MKRRFLIATAIAELLTAVGGGVSQAQTVPPSSPQPVVISSQCAWISHQHPEFEPLARVCETAHAMRQTLPNFICDQKRDVLSPFHSCRRHKLCFARPSPSSQRWTWLGGGIPVRLPDREEKQRGLDVAAQQPANCAGVPRDDLGGQSERATHSYHALADASAHEIDASVPYRFVGSEIDYSEVTIAELGKFFCRRNHNW